MGAGGGDAVFLHVVDGNLRGSTIWETWYVSETIVIVTVACNKERAESNGDSIFQPLAILFYILFGHKSDVLFLFSLSFSTL